MYGEKLSEEHCSVPCAYKTYSQREKIVEIDHAQKRCDNDA